MSLLYSSTCFEHNHAHHQEVKIVSHSIWHHHTLQAAVRCTLVHRTANGSNLQQLLSLEQLKCSGSFYRGGVNNTRNSHLCYCNNPHGNVKSNYQHRFSVNMSCGVIGDQLLGPYIFAQHLTGDIYTNFLQDELPALLENVPLQT